MRLNVMANMPTQLFLCSAPAVSGAILTQRGNAIKYYSHSKGTHNMTEIYNDRSNGWGDYIIAASSLPHARNIGFHEGTKKTPGRILQSLLSYSSNIVYILRSYHLLIG